MPCPRCGKPLTHLVGHARFFCDFKAFINSKTGRLEAELGKTADRMFYYQCPYCNAHVGWTEKIAKELLGSGEISAQILRGNPYY